MSNSDFLFLERATLLPTQSNWNPKVIWIFQLVKLLFVSTLTSP